MRSAYCSFVGLLVLSISTAAAQERRPNVIAIVTDDQGRWAMGTYGNQEISTPHMDRIGREGAVFTNAFVATPVCSPSRATYLSGRWPTEVGITDYIAPVESDAGLGLHGLIWPRVLQQHGVRTALVGKWHLGTHARFHPTALGFDRFVGFLEGGTKPMNAPLEIDGKTTQTTGALPDVLVDHAIKFVRDNRNRPFALCLHFRAPHLPYGPVPDVDSQQYAGLDPTVPAFRGADIPQLKQSARAYYASISSVDRNVGRLLQFLDELGLTRDTIVFFTSDHGYNEGRHSINTKGNGHWIAGGVRGPKRPNMWDTSVRVPLVVRWPAAIKPGTRIEHTVSQIDMFRTVLGALNIPMPEDATVHGFDYSPLFRGEEIPPRKFLFGMYDLHNRGLAYMRMIRTPRYKLIVHYKTNYMDELYDLEADPEENRNLIRRGSESKIAQSLRSQLVEWQKSINDPILKSNY